MPGTPVVITPDVARGIKYKGALVYVNDFEGKITKFNLTNMENDGAGKDIKLYDSTILLLLKRHRNNGRYQYHSMDAGIGRTSKHFWMFSGTGDYERMTSKDANIDNIMLDLEINIILCLKNIVMQWSLMDYNLEKCMDTTGDTLRC